MSRTEDDVVVLLRSLLGDNWLDPNLTGAAGPLLRGLGHAFAEVGRELEQQDQAGYLIAHGTQTETPATGPRHARFIATLEHRGDLGTALLCEPETMQLQGPDGRLYLNETRLFWRRKDQTRTRQCVFRAVIPGRNHNLDFLEYPKGSGTIPVEYITWKDRSRGRTNQGASAVVYEGRGAIKDTGIPSVFEDGDKGLFVKIVGASVPLNAERVLRIQAHRWPAVEEPAGSNTFPGYALVDDQETPDNVYSAKLEDGGVFSTYTSEINDDTTTFPLLPATVAVNDAFYIGSAYAFNKIDIFISQAGEGDWELAIEFFDGFVWLPVPNAKDDTTGFRRGGWSTIDLGDGIGTQPVIDGVSAYWVRLRVTSVTTTTVQPLGLTAWVSTNQDLIPEDGTIAWSVLDHKDLGLVVTEVTTPAGGRDADLDMIGTERGVFRSAGETDIDYYRRVATLPDVDSPKALERIVNGHLRPTGLTGRIYDIGNKITGLWFDFDAFDYYQAGGIYPKDPYKLMLSWWAHADGESGEAYGFFYVMVPWLADGEFGAFFDAGPLLYLEDKQLYVGPAFDGGFMDGKPVIASEIYKAIYRDILLRKMGGVDFRMIPTLELNTP